MPNSSYLWRQTDNEISGANKYQIVKRGDLHSILSHSQVQLDHRHKINRSCSSTYVINQQLPCSQVDPYTDVFRVSDPDDRMMEYGTAVGDHAVQPWTDYVFPNGNGHMPSRWPRNRAIWCPKPPPSAAAQHLGEWLVEFEIPKIYSDNNQDPY